LASFNGGLVSNKLRIIFPEITAASASGSPLHRLIQERNIVIITKLDRPGLWGLLAIVWMAIIYVLSDTPGADYESLKDSTSWLPAATFFAHTALYFVLSVFVLRFLIVLKRLPIGLMAYMTVFVATAYGMLDELHQSNIEGRASEGGDVLVDLFGAVLVVVLWFALRQRSQKKSSRYERRNGN
jgi:VanZ family protein